MVKMVNMHLYPWTLVLSKNKYMSSLECLILSAFSKITFIVDEIWCKLLILHSKYWTAMFVHAVLVKYIWMGL